MGNGPVPRYAERRISKRLLNLPLTRSAYLRAGEQSDFRIRNAAGRYLRAAGPVRSGGFDRLGSDSRRTAQRRRALREIGRAHVSIPVTNAHLVYRLRLD